MSRIEPLREFPYTFDQENLQRITEMIPRFGNAPEDIIIKALSLLYTIYRDRPNAKHVLVQDSSGKTVIPL